MWVATPELPRTAGHPFYARLNHILHKHDFNGVRRTLRAILCRRGRPAWSATGPRLPTAADRYFEGLDAERAIAWRAADSFALRDFLGLVLPEAPPLLDRQQPQPVDCGSRFGGCQLRSLFGVDSFLSHNVRKGRRPSATRGLSNENDDGEASSSRLSALSRGRTWRCCS